MNCFISSSLKIPLRQQRSDVITAFNNTINTKNEGKKHDSYQRFLSKKKATNMCKIVVQSNENSVNLDYDVNNVYLNSININNFNMSSDLNGNMCINSNTVSCSSSQSNSYYMPITLNGETYFIKLFIPV
jgi:hypothetical protein